MNQIEKIIDIATWNRREHYEHFSAFDDPFFGVTVQVDCTRTYQEAKAKGFTGIDYNFKVFDQHPEWVEEAHRCGLKVNAWTTNKEEDLKRMRDLGVDFVTTDHPVEAIRLMKEKS